MTKSIWALVAAGLIAVGCSNEGTMTPASSDASVAPGIAAEGAEVDELTAAEEPADEFASDASLSTAASDGAAPASATREVALTPQNTQIRFVGIHTGDKPDPREGNFEAFQGKAVIEGDRLTSVEVTIETASLTTQIDRLTNHLKSADFFDVNEYPQATFRSTRIEPDGSSSDKMTVTGDLTLHGVTRSVSFPATVSTEDGLSLNAEFSIDRTDFGMTYGEERVVAEVSLSVSVDA